MNKIFLKNVLSILSGFLIFNPGQALFAQTPVTYNSAEILQQLEKLNTLGTVLYIAAHPDDENTRLLTFLSKEKKYRTGYLSLTRGDGGQNLIGDEQGVELGMIRTQELLAARRVDGTEQFFTRAYDFGFSKNPTETFKFWDKEKVLADVVFIIRKFRPDVIITRFPTTGEGGHGHHTASAILAEEAFEIAGDPTKFPEQLNYVKPWRPKRLLWNTFNFGSNNTIRDDQFKVAVGHFNPLLGKSYGEIAAESRSQHKSQGFGVPRSRGEALEYFKTIKGNTPEKELLDDVNVTWNRIGDGMDIMQAVTAITSNYNPVHPEASILPLVKLYNRVGAIDDENWKKIKQAEIRSLIAACAGLWIDATTTQPAVVPGESFLTTLALNKRLEAPVMFKGFSLGGRDSLLNTALATNRNYSIPFRIAVAGDFPLTQPYWLRNPMGAGFFDVKDPLLTGLPDTDPAYIATIDLDIAGTDFRFTVPVMYRYTDPVKGELYQPLQVVPPVQVKVSPDVLLFRKGQASTQSIATEIFANTAIAPKAFQLVTQLGKRTIPGAVISKQLEKGGAVRFQETVISKDLINGELTSLKISVKDSTGKTYKSDKVQIDYDHIPTLHYFYEDSVKILNLDLQTAGKRIGYIAGAGDKVPQALEQMGYELVMLKESDLQAATLKRFDAVITGVRAYNVHSFLQNRYEALMDYVKEGGNLIVQYNTNNQIGPVKARIGPYPFNISRNRVTDETAAPVFDKKEHRVFNWPNRITAADFNGWVQERGIYFADQLAPQYETALSFADPGESPQNGGLIMANYGKGTFVYTGLVFFRELPAGVPGAYRLLANIIALNQKKPF